MDILDTRRSCYPPQIPRLCRQRSGGDLSLKFALQRLARIWRNLKGLSAVKLQDIIGAEPYQAAVQQAEARSGKLVSSRPRSKQRRLETVSGSIIVSHGACLSSEGFGGDGKGAEKGSRKGAENEPKRSRK